MVMTVKDVFSKELVIKIAKLSNLSVEGEEAFYADIFGQTIDYIKVLDEIDTSNVLPTYQVTGLTNIFQTAKPSTLSKDEALQNASQPLKGKFATKGVFDRPE